MEKNKILILLISLSIIFTLINLYSTFHLNDKFEVFASNLATTDNKILRTEVDTDDDPFKGSKKAPITIIEFSDFQCPYCAKFFTQTLPFLEEEYIKTGKVKLVYRDFPLSFHEFAAKASEASECADEQGKFWEYHDKIFNNQKQINVENLKNWALELGLNTEKFNNCLDSDKYRDEVLNDIKDGSSAGVQGTPAYFINGVLVEGAQPYENFKNIIEKELKN